MEFTQTQVNTIVAEAQQAALDASVAFFNQTLGGQDNYPCGFAWVDIYGVKGNTRLGRMLKAAGVERSDYKKCFTIWNPAGISCQNVDAKEVGARAAADVFQKYGFRAYPCSRLD